MSTKKIILLLLLACIGGILFLFACRQTYESKIADLNAKALTAFAEAIDDEFQSRKIQGDISINVSSTAVNSASPEKIYLVDEAGRHEYLLDPEKNKLNITDDANLRSLHSIAFKIQPLQPDSLNAKWREYMMLPNLNLKSALRISLVKEDGSIKSQSDTCQSEWCKSSHLIFTRYVGYACEIEVLCFLSFSKWGLIYKEVLLYLVLYLILVFAIYKLFIFFDCKLQSLRKKEIVKVINEVPVEIIKEVPVEVHIIEEVQKVDATNIHTYKLGEHIIFYADKKIIVADGVEQKVQAQSCLLLELFLNESMNDYILEDNVIKEKLWPDGSGNDTRMLKAIGRLRSFIKNMDSSIEILRKVNAYQLIIPEDIT